MLAVTFPLRWRGRKCGQQTNEKSKRMSGGEVTDRSRVSEWRGMKEPLGKALHNLAAGWVSVRRWERERDEGREEGKEVRRVRTNKRYDLARL